MKFNLGERDVLPVRNCKENKRIASFKCSENIACKRERERDRQKNLTYTRF